MSSKTVITELSMEKGWWGEGKRSVTIKGKHKGNILRTFTGLYLSVINTTGIRLSM